MKEYIYSLMTDRRNDIWANGLKAILFLLSLVFNVLITIRGLLYDIKVISVKKVPQPVISIGNITMGGVGKTPLAIYLVSILLEKGKSAAVLTRGYATGREGSYQSDEVVLLKSELRDMPVLVDGNRFRAAAGYKGKKNIDVFVMDDGFQHRRLKRDIDIVALDATNPWGNGYLLPRGILREKISSLKRADFIILTKSDLGAGNIKKIKEELKSYGCLNPLLLSVHEPCVFTDIEGGREFELSIFEGKEIMLLSSIGNPRSFEDTLTKVGARINHHIQYRDHHVYTGGDILQIQRQCQQRKCFQIVTTEKDAVKLTRFSKVWNTETIVRVLKIKIMVTEGKESLLERIDHLFCS